MYCCQYCKRSYQRKIYFDRHTAMCQLLNKSAHDRHMELEEQTDTPSVRKLYEALMALTMKYNELEQKMLEMSKCVQLKKPKINLLEYLNTTYGESFMIGYDYEVWFQNIQIQRADLEVLFASDFVKGTLKCLQRFLPLADEERRPLRAFQGKEGVFYYYEKSSKQWQILPDDIFLKLMYALDKLFMTEFVNWQRENKNKMESDAFSEVYLLRTKKMMVTRTPVYVRIRRELYLYLRTEIPAEVA